MKLRIEKSVQENEWIDACLKNDRKAQRALYERYAPKMLGICARYIRDRSEAEDVMIKGFMRVFEKLETYQGKGSFEGWICRIMVNEALGYLRKNKSMYLEVEIEKAEREPDLNKIDQMMQAGDIIKIINELPVGYRTVFNMYAIEGYSHKEIGEMLGISENTSKSQLSRARMLLQKRLLEMENMLDQKVEGGYDGK
ncbi:MAG TPA: RNA polymerase subunit sigma-70 [Cytophagales bacterium]|jgi:RNA polymerase sigma factor (sigma-70 family)|nr:RNA polymerase subunit sigma-70 [Cytophagales bacterium]